MPEHGFSVINTVGLASFPFSGEQEFIWLQPWRSKNGYERLTQKPEEEKKKEVIKHQEIRRINLIETFKINHETLCKIWN
ncbi:hypothetical protein ANTPLA_LOCUS5556 [Anthophora plagiata]